MRVSATMLEQFRRVLTDEYATEADLIAQIKGEPWKPSWQMRAGTAWHSVLESPEATQHREQRAEGSIDVWHAAGTFTFSGDAVAAALEIIGEGLHEVKATDIWQTAFGPCTVVAQADLVYGRQIQDQKAKFSSLDVRSYERSLQWRVYLAAHGAERFRYNFWMFKEPDGAYCELKDCIQCVFWAYPDMHADCLGWLNRFLGWADSRGLIGCLDREGSSVSAPAA